MTARILMILTAAIFVAGCEKEQAAGFTGIGKPTTTQAASSHYSLLPVAVPDAQ